MEKFPYQSELSRAEVIATPGATGAHGATVALRPSVPMPATSDWRSALPVLAGAHVTLRELRVEDAPSLLAMVTTDEVARFISPPPATVEGFEQFIDWAQKERHNGTYACFAIVPAGMTRAVGLIQVRSMDAGFNTGEWGFALGSAFWGKGLFAEAAGLALDFAFGTIGVHRLEARAAVANGRGNGALRKLGAVQEGVLRRSLLKDGTYLDQILWGILAEDWRALRSPRGTVVH